MRRRAFHLTSAAVLLTLLVTSDTSAYSVLAHEAMIDAVWADHFVPLLRHRFPAS